MVVVSVAGNVDCRSFFLETAMPTDIVSTDDCCLMIGLTEPTDNQYAVVDMIRKGVEAAARNACGWQITEQEFTVFLPRYMTPTGSTVRTANLWQGYSSALAGYSNVSRGRNRLQLPSPFVSVIDSVYLDNGAIAGEGAEDFPESSLLDPETDYYLEVEKTATGGKAFSCSGGLIRVGVSWPSVAGTLKITYTSGFDSDDLDGDFLDLKYAIIQEVAGKWVLRNSTADGGSGGLLKSEKIGDYSVAYETPSAGQFSMVGLSESLQDFLVSNGFVFFDVGV